MHGPAISIHRISLFVDRSGRHQCRAMLLALRSKLYHKYHQLVQTERAERNVIRLVNMTTMVSRSQNVDYVQLEYKGYYALERR